MNLAGKFIVLDGPDGAGKGTQLDRLSAWIQAERGVVRRARDPGGTEIGDRIRHILLDFDLTNIDPRCETLLFMASRAQLARQVIRPALELGQTVLCDRFISATCAYQGALGLPVEDILTLGRLAVGNTWPDLTLVLDVPPELGFERTGRKPAPGRRTDAGQRSMLDGATADAMERRPLEFHRRVRQIFCDLPRVYPRPVVVVDGTPAPDVVSTRVREAVAHTFR